MIVGCGRVRVMVRVKQGDSTLVGHWRVKNMMGVKQGDTNSGPLEG